MVMSRLQTYVLARSSLSLLLVLFLQFLCLLAGGQEVFNAILLGPLVVLSNSLLDGFVGLGLEVQGEALGEMTLG